MILKTETSSEAFASLLRVFERVPVNASPRGLPVRELLNVQVSVEQPSDAPFATASSARNARMSRYLAAEFALYESGEDRVEKFAEHAAFWRGVADGDRVNSAYGRLVFFDKSLPGNKTPWEWAYEALLRDRDTRQAVVQYLQPRHFVEGTRDFVCTCHGVFHVRGDALTYSVHMRSNDLVRGFAYDVPWHMRCQMRMHHELTAAGVHVRLGRYTHTVNSLHVYERDAPLVHEMLYGTTL